VVVTLQPVTELPELLLLPLVEESLAQGFRAIHRLVDEWQTEKNRFSKPGEALFAAWFADHVIGVCGLNQDPYADANQIGRIRRLYVQQAYRRQGVGRQLVEQIICTAKPNFVELRLRTTDAIAAHFYASLGFHPVNLPNCTHSLKLR